ncbi:MAG: Lrp/AsnC family transcriptional regulator [Verrucomicrobia bacterium]|nr:Lrp/AsnC family transcriptional regulator [Verrucomicrobiota bacterium]
MTQTTVPIAIGDPVNHRILEVSEDKVRGFQRDPFAEISRLSGVDAPAVIERIRAMLAAGIIRRVRQTLLANNLAPGALVAWKVSEEKLTAGFEFLLRNDPFSGHIVIRSTDVFVPGCDYKLWTTLKVPQGYSVQKHCEFLMRQLGATAFRLMPAKRMFALGVGHMRRRGIKPGSKGDAPAEPIEFDVVRLSDLEWRVLIALKRELQPEELCRNLWDARAHEASVPLEKFCEIAEDFSRRKLIGRFSTFLEHVKPLASGEKVTGFNGLFHWAVPAGRELEAGAEVGRFHALTHAYWRDAGPDFGNVNIMAVAHAPDKETVLAHKTAIDAHLKQCGIQVSLSAVYWGGRSEIKPSEISPFAYRDWCKSMGLDPNTMRE